MKNNTSSKSLPDGKKVSNLYMLSRKHQIYCQILRGMRLIQKKGKPGSDNDKEKELIENEIQIR